MTPKSGDLFSEKFMRKQEKQSVMMIRRSVITLGARAK
jgi:hypothetical protein